MNEPDDGQDSVLTPAYRKPNRHNAKLCPLAIRGRIVNALAASDSQAAIARALRVSRNTISAVAEQEWSKLEQRKARIAAQSERNATRAAELIAEKLEREDVPLNAGPPRSVSAWTNSSPFVATCPQICPSISNTTTSMNSFSAT